MKDKKESLIAAAETNDLTTVKTLVSQGADVNVRYKGTYALHSALENGATNVADYLLSLGNIEVNLLDSSERSPLLVAMCYDHDEIALRLIKRSDTCLTLQSPLESTPLTYAIYREKKTLVQAILAKTSFKDAHLHPEALNCVIRLNDKNLLTQLLDKGFNPFLPDNIGLKSMPESLQREEYDEKTSPLVLKELGLTALSLAQKLCREKLLLIIANYIEKTRSALIDRFSKVIHSLRPEQLLEINGQLNFLSELGKKISSKKDSFSTKAVKSKSSMQKLMDEFTSVPDSLTVSYSPPDDPMLIDSDAIGISVKPSSGPGSSFFS